MNAIAFRSSGKFFFAILVCSCWAEAALGTTYDQRPRPTILLSDSLHFIAQDGWNSVALFRVKDGVALHRFQASQGLGEIAITSNEKLLLLACDDGSLLLWEIDTGKQLWRQSASQSGLKYAYDACFAQNGESCIVCDYRDQALIFDTHTGRRIGIVQFPTMQTNIMTAALSPDGTKGALITLGGNLYTFDVASGQLTDTKVTGAWPVRFSADGKYIACRSDNSGSSEQLRVIALHEKGGRKDVGQFSYIGHIKPLSDGTFIVAAQAGVRDATGGVVGMQIWPDTGKIEQIWKYPNEKNIGEKTDFLPGDLIGVSTDFRLVTTVFDLRTGNSLLSIDNSANYRPIILSYTSRDLVSGDGRIVLAFGLIGFSLFALAVWVVIRRRRAKCKGEAHVQNENPKKTDP